jgi:hypothetical protein
MAKISRTFKQKIKILNTVSNNIIYNKLEYGLHHLYERQTQLHATNWISRINNNNIAGDLSRHRLQILQNAYWSSSNILENLQDPIHKPGINLTHDIIWTLSQLGISFYSRNTSDMPICIHPIDTSIESIIDKKFFLKHRNNLQKHNLMFIGQILNENRTKTLNWNQIVKPNQKGKKGKTPFWYSDLLIKTNLLISRNSPLIQNIGSNNTFHQYSFLSPSNKTRKH